jgi:hypothetical protein
VSSLLDEVIPEFQFSSRHARHVAAPPARVADAVERYDLRRDASPLVRLLFRARGLGVPSGSFRDAVAAGGFTMLAERPGEERVFGTVGRFWAIRERANMERPSDEHAFRRFRRPGWPRPR